MNGPSRRPVRVSPEPAAARPGEAPVVVDLEADDSGGPHGSRNEPIGSVGPIDAAGRRRVEVVVDGWRFEFLVEDEARADLRERASRDRAATSAAGGALEIRAIIPGRVATVSVATGDVVEAGQTLLAVEAMKMQNELRAPRDGTVVRVPAAAGATVELGDVLVVLE